ncbi:MAG: glutaminyl-peptide cyclotransferase [Deltaproteobacteria bacterium]
MLTKPTFFKISRQFNVLTFMHAVCLLIFNLVSPDVSESKTPVNEQNSATVYGYEIINTYPHDIGAFTQGLVIDDGIMYESTGIKGRSTVRKVDLKTGKILDSIEVPARHFGEGITIVGKRIIHLTWRSGKGFVYNKNTLDTLASFSYPTEGWGITYDGRNLIMSDGSSNLYFLDPASFEQVGILHVYSEDGPVGKLNELEYVEGEILANLWESDRIARIDPKSGRVTGWIELNGLLTAEDRKTKVGVLNGIAYDSREKRLFVTGKLWPKIFEIKPVPKK